MLCLDGSDAVSNGNSCSELASDSVDTVRSAVQRRSRIKLPSSADCRATNASNGDITRCLVECCFFEQLGLLSHLYNLCTLRCVSLFYVTVRKEMIVKRDKF